MPVALILIGMIMAAAAFNNSLAQLSTLVKSDLFGSKPGDYGFIVWAGSILIIAAILRALDLPEAGKLLIGLVILSFLLGHANIPSQVLTALEGAGSVTGNPAQSDAPAYPNNLPGQTGAKAK